MNVEGFGCYLVPTTGDSPRYKGEPLLEAASAVDHGLKMFQVAQHYGLAGNDVVRLIQDIYKAYNLNQGAKE